MALNLPYRLSCLRLPLAPARRRLASTRAPPPTHALPAVRPASTALAVLPAADGANGAQQPLLRLLPLAAASVLAAGLAYESLGGLVALDESGTAAALAAVAEDLYASKTKAKKIYRKLEGFVETGNAREDAEVLWRLARAAKDFADDTMDADKRKELVYKGYEAAMRALELDNENFACHKWVAIMLTRIGDYEGNKAKLLNAYKMKEHFEAAIRLNPTDATSRHLLGVWCFTFADMPWYQRKAAAALFATPPSSTYEEALSHFEAAEALEPGFYTKNAYYLGLTYTRMGRAADAEHWYEKCLAMVAYNGDDREAHTLARQALG